MKIKSLILTAALAMSIIPITQASEVIGSVDTAFKLLGANHKIVMEVFDDPLVQV